MTKFLAVVVSVILIISSYTAQAASKSTSINLEPQVAVGAYMGLVEDHLAGVLRTVSVVAQTSEAKSAKWETVKPLLDRISKDLPTGPTVWLALPDGSYYTVESGGLTDQTLMSRPYFSRLLGGQDVLGDLVISRSTHQRYAVVASPVIENGKVVAVIGVSVKVHLLTALIESKMKLPDKAYFYALDTDTKIILHRHLDRVFKMVENVGDEKLAEGFKSSMKKDEGVFNYTLNGKKMCSVFQKSKTLGWYFFIAQEKK
jgi:methyl-accepting chemotaxis protein